MPQPERSSHCRNERKPTPNTVKRLSATGSLRTAKIYKFFFYNPKDNKLIPFSGGEGGEAATKQTEQTTSNSPFLILT